MLVNIEKKQSQVCVNENIKKSIIVSSHERSGTHFLMNSVAINSNYTVNPYLNFDLMPLGDTVNFFSPQNVGNFINKISNIRHQNKEYGLSSLIKSHHPSYVFDNLFDKPNINFLYIYRDPKETLLSFWKFINHWDWHEGPKLNNPLNFIKAAPEGQMQRYQKKSYNSIFLRWAHHVLEWIEVSKRYQNIFVVNYNDLNSNYNSTIGKIFNFLELPINNLSKPPKNNYVNTKQIEISKDNYEEFLNFIIKNLSQFPELKKILTLNDN